MSEENMVESILEAGRAQAGLINAPDIAAPFLLVPHDTTLVSLDKFMPAPDRKRATVTLQDPDSFARYVEAHKTGQTALFADLRETGATFLAIFDYHGPGHDGMPGWREHRAVYPCPESVEW